MIRTELCTLLQAIDVVIIISSNNVSGSSTMSQFHLLTIEKKYSVSPVSYRMSLSKQMTITHIDRGIYVALLTYKKSSKISPRRSHIVAKGVFKCQEGVWQIQLPAHYSRHATSTQAKGATSPHSIWTCSEAYGSGPRERAPICSPSWARLAHSQAPHTFGWFINQPLPTIPVHRLIHV